MTYKLPSLFLASTVAALLILSGGAQAHERYTQDVNYYEGECREYTQDIWIYGQKRIANGVACYKGHGQWDIVSSSVGYNRHANAGPIVILPQKYARQTHSHQPVVIYKQSPTVIYKNNNPKNWAYQHPVKHGKKKGHKKHQNFKYDNRHDHHDDGVTIKFNW